MNDEWNMKCARGTKHNINIVIIYQLRIRNGCSVCRLILSYFPCVFLSIWWQAALTRLLAALHMNEQLALAKVIIMSELLQKKILTWITSVFPGCCSHDSLIHAIHTQIHTIIIPTMPAYTRKWDRENIFRIFATVDTTKQKKTNQISREEKNKKICHTYIVLTPSGCNEQVFRLPIRINVRHAKNWKRDQRTEDGPTAKPKKPEWNNNEWTRERSEKNNKKPLIENQPYICCCGEGKKRMNAEIFRGIHSLSIYFIITTGIMYVGVLVVVVLAFKSNEIFSISLWMNKQIQVQKLS